MQSGPHEAAAVSNDSITRILREGNKETFAAAKDAIMQQVLTATVQEAIEDLGSPDAIAERALRQVDAQHTVLSQTVAQVKERLLAEVAHRSMNELADARAAALQAQEKIEHGLGHQAIVSAKDLLKERLIEAVARRCTDELADPEDVARQARSRISEDAEALVYGQKALTKNLIAEVAARSTHELDDPEDVARQARVHIDNTHTVITGAVVELKQRLIAEIADRSTEELADPAAAARQAQALIAPEHTVMLKAIDKLKEQLLETIVQESLAKINGAMTKPPQDRPPAAPLREKKAYVKNQVIDARGPDPTEAAEAPGTASPAPTMRRRKAANGYEADTEPLPKSEPVESAEGAPAAHYVYGIVAKSSLALADALAKADIKPPYTPYLVPYQSITAIVGDLPGSVLTAIDATWQNNVRRIQERVLEQINTAGFAALPMYAPTTHTNRTYLEKALAQYARTLHTTLETLADKQEWNVKIYCDPAKVQQEISTSDETIEGFLEQFAASAGLWSEAGAEAEVEAIREGLQTSLPEVVDAILSNCQHHIHRTLDGVSLTSRVAPASEDSVFGSSRMVHNAAYLIVETQDQTFRAALEHLSARYESLGLVYYIGGPHPPCRFAAPDVPML